MLTKTGTNYAPANLASIIAVSGATCICIAILLIRAVAYRTFDYWFLGFNLLLAWVPLVAAVGFSLLMRVRRSPIWWFPAVALLIVWLAFLPNAPYLLTDLFHWRRQATWQGWFELLMFFSFGLTGMMIGFEALRLVHAAMAERIGWRLGWLFVAGISVATGFGVYIGRFLRWNSWDIATSALADILAAVVRLLRYPTSHALPLAFIALVAALFMCGYLFFAGSQCINAPVARPPAPPVDRDR